MKSKDRQYKGKALQFSVHPFNANQNSVHPATLGSVNQRDLAAQKLTITALFATDIELDYRHGSKNLSSATSAADFLNCTSLMFLLFLMISSF